MTSRERKNVCEGWRSARPLCHALAGARDRALYFKPESLQPTGAFKLRGAYNKISSLSPEERAPRGRRPLQR